MSESRAPIVIFACGNPSRGDDALGPLLLDRLRVWLARQGLAADFELIGDFQLQIEHALDLEGRRLALFIDAGEQTPAPFVFRQVDTGDAGPPGSHALAPESVLAVFRRVSREKPPAAFVLCVRGERFALGEALGALVRRHAEAAFALLTDLCANSGLAYWQQVAHSSVLARSRSHPPKY